MRHDLSVGVGLLWCLLGCASSGDGAQSVAQGVPADPNGLPVAGTGGASVGQDSIGTSGSVQPGVAGESIPCAPAQVVERGCLGCHGAQPVGGAIKLVTYDDWHQPSPNYGPNVLGDSSKKVHEVARIRIGNGEMPQNGALAENEHAVLDAWLAGGALAGDPNDPSCGASAPPSTTGDPVLQEGMTLDECERPGAYDELVARPGETCYEFPVHGSSSPGDTSKFSVPTGESYHEFYYDVPWNPTDQMTRFGARFDNLEVLHHYLTFASNAQGKGHGQVDMNVLGTTLGSEATLISGWAVGGCSMEYPEDVGAELPAAAKIMVQWHMYNFTGQPQQDGSVVQICTVPGGTRPNTAGITFLGTENFNGFFGMPPGPNSFTTECKNNSGAPVTLIGFTPHMHLIGTNMKTEVRRLDGSVSTLFDEPFKFDYQVGYRIPRAVVQPGETLITTCSFMNDTGASVAFGQSTKQEMCYQYALAYPAGALNNGAPSLIGAVNTCW